MLLISSQPNSTCTFIFSLAVALSRPPRPRPPSVVAALARSSPASLAPQTPTTTSTTTSLNFLPPRSNWARLPLVTTCHHGQRYPCKFSSPHLFLLFDLPHVHDHARTQLSVWAQRMTPLFVPLWRAPACHQRGVMFFVRHLVPRQRKHSACTRGRSLHPCRPQTPLVITLPSCTTRRAHRRDLPSSFFPFVAPISAAPLRQR